MKRFKKSLLLCQLRLTSEEGQGLLEYVLLAVLIAMALISTLTSLGVTLPTIFQLITEQLQGDRR
jgi:Flp pilus assembly pilin Flp